MNHLKNSGINFRWRLKTLRALMGSIRLLGTSCGVLNTTAFKQKQNCILTFSRVLLKDSHWLFPGDQRAVYPWFQPPPSWSVHLSRYFVLSLGFTRQGVWVPSVWMPTTSHLARHIFLKLLRFQLWNICNEYLVGKIWCFFEMKFGQRKSLLLSKPRQSSPTCRYVFCRTCLVYLLA